MSAAIQADDVQDGTGVPAPSHIPAGEGQSVWYTTNLMVLKATARSTGGAFGLIEALAPAGSGPPLHVHQREDEAFWILEGQLTVRRGERLFSAEAGSYTFLPRGLPHTFVVEGNSPARILSICSPGGLEQYFVAAGRPAETDGLPPAGPVDVALLARVGQQFGVEILGPPIAPTREPT
ncbi:MAG TPA: cupin domain-containing protein [Solirubrobacteraceae bacterium]|nr:cupin domain-containing protein [Solirubrobacteraceae bacterium]